MWNGLRNIGLTISRMKIERLSFRDNGSAFAFTAGRGGVDANDPYSGFNCCGYVGDSPRHVASCREELCRGIGLPAGRLITARQVHGTDVVVVGSPDCVSGEADALVTRLEDVAVGVFTADCVPMLFYDKEAGVVGAAHAGWRGALNGIVENTVKIMIEHGAHVENIHAAVGPCLQQQSFECKEDMRREFLHKDEENNRWFKDKADGEHFLFNLEGFVVHKLEQLGIGNISASGIDTFTAIGDFFSYRRNCKLGLVQSPKDFPSHLSTIKL